MRLVLVSVLLLCGSTLAAPSTQPDLAALKANVTRAEAGITTARAEAVQRLEASPAFRALLAEQAAKQKVLSEARASGTPQDRVDASGAYNRARAAVQKARDAVEDDPLLLGAVKKLADARKDLADGAAAAEAAPLPKPEGLSKHEWELAATLAASKSTPDVYLHELAVGAVGRLRYPGMASVADSYKVTVTVKQILSKGEMLCGAYDGTVGDGTIYLVGIETSGLIDGKTVRLPDGVYCVPATKTYTTVAGGTRTVFIVEAVNASRITFHVFFSGNWQLTTGNL